MRWDAGVLAGVLIGLVWLVAGTVLVVVGRRRRRAAAAQGAEGSGNVAVIGIFLLVVGALTWFATLLLSVVPG